MAAVSKLPTSYPALDATAPSTLRTFSHAIAQMFQRIAVAFNNPDNGTTAERPPSQLTTGQFYFDTTLNGPVWWDGAAWVGAGGSTLGPDLTAIEALAGTGIATRTAADTWALRTLTQPAAGLTIANPAGVGGNPTFALGNDLAALEAMAGTGLVTRTGSETYAQRIITGTTSRLTVSNGDGIAGNPTLDIDVAYAGQTSIVTLGTVTTGTWNGTVVSEAFGGTGESAYTNGQLLIGNTSTGGFDKATLTAGSGVTVTNGAGSITIAATAAGPGGSSNDIQYNNAGAFGGLTLDDGELLIGDTGGVPVPATLTAGSGIEITNGAGSIVVAGRGLWDQARSATPTSSNTGLTTWLNQGGATVNDRVTGITINAPSSASDNIRARYKAVPSTPYSFKALLGISPPTLSASNFVVGGIGWYDGSAKLHTIDFIYETTLGHKVRVARMNSVTSFSALDFGSAFFAGSPAWLRIRDDGTTVYFQLCASGDDNDFITVYSVAKSSGFLGSSGYANVLLFANRVGTTGSLPAQVTLFSWQQGS